MHLALGSCWFFAEWGRGAGVSSHWYPEHLERCLGHRLRGMDEWRVRPQERPRATRWEGGPGCCVSRGCDQGQGRVAMEVPAVSRQAAPHGPAVWHREWTPGESGPAWHRRFPVPGRLCLWGHRGFVSHPCPHLKPPKAPLSPSQVAEHPENLPRDPDVIG